MLMPGFHEVRFPLAIGFGSSGGPERRTDVVLLASGHEERNSRWADSRRRFNAGTGVHSLADLHMLIGFFEERRGRLYGFRWRDRSDWKSCAPGETPLAEDQQIGVGDSATATFQLIKTYGGGVAPYQRKIAKPVGGTVRVSVNGEERTAGVDFNVNHTTGAVTFIAGTSPPTMRSSPPVSNSMCRRASIPTGSTSISRRSRRGMCRTCRWWRSGSEQIANGE
jgi:uncharacterized protein (TIGR02217 family)